MLVLSYLNSSYESYSKTLRKMADMTGQISFRIRLALPTSAQHHTFLPSRCWVPSSIGLMEHQQPQQS